MRVVFRTDSSTVIGTGHLIRCQTLARRLAADGASITFICRDLPGNLASTVRDRGFDLMLLPQPDGTGIIAGAGEYARWLGVDQACDTVQTIETIAALKPVDCLIVDHYGLSAEWEARLRLHVGTVMAIDDLANRPHDVDILLDQNLHEHGSRRYVTLVPYPCYILAGPGYALLRDDFLLVREQLRRRIDRVRRALVFYGGADATNETGKAIAALRATRIEDLAVTIVIGPANPHRQALIAKVASDCRFTILEGVTNMANLMAESDLALGAGGTTTWERCCVGLPTLITAVANNQVSIAREIDRAGAAVYLGTADQVRIRDLTEAILTLAQDTNRLETLRCRGMALVDGNGTNRVAAAVRDLIPEEAQA